jgi:ribosomal protein L25 (general stress protein Ctc)
MNKKDSPDDLQEKIMAGMKLAFERLVEKKKKENSYLIFSVDGKVTKVMAKDIKI